MIIRCFHFSKNVSLMSDYPLRVKIVASIAIVLAYVIGLPLFVLMYGAGALADWSTRRP